MVHCICYVYDMYITCIYRWYTQTNAVGCCSSTNRWWKTWLGRMTQRFKQYNWIELEWKRPWSAFSANQVCAILLCWPWWTGQICICVFRWVLTSMDMLWYTEIYYVYVISYVLTKYFMLHQGQSLAPGLDAMLLKQQFLSMSGQAANQAMQHPPVEYMFCTYAWYMCCI